MHIAEVLLLRKGQSEKKGEDLCATQDKFFCLHYIFCPLLSFIKLGAYYTQSSHTQNLHLQIFLLHHNNVYKFTFDYLRCYSLCI